MRGLFFFTPAGGGGGGFGPLFGLALVVLVAIALVQGVRAVARLFAERWRRGQARRGRTAAAAGPARGVAARPGTDRTPDGRDPGGQGSADPPAARVRGDS